MFQKSRVATLFTIPNIHLGDGFHIPYSSWPFIKVQESHSKYVKYLAEALWGNYQLSNSYVKESNEMVELEGISPRKKLQSPMKAVLKRCFKDRLANQNIPSIEHTKLLRKVGTYLGQHICSIRHRMYPGSVTKKKRQREEYDEELEGEE